MRKIENVFYESWCSEFRLSRGWTMPKILLKYIQKRGIIGPHIGSCKLLNPHWIQHALLYIQANIYCCCLALALWKRGWSLRARHLSRVADLMGALLWWGGGHRARYNNFRTFCTFFCLIFTGIVFRMYGMYGSEIFWYRGDWTQDWILGWWSNAVPTWLIDSNYLRRSAKSERHNEAIQLM